jgi:hypothetical protein
MRWLLVLLAVTALAYAGFFLSLANPPFIDAPNHLARAVIINSLWADPHSPFQGAFSATHSFVPYMLPDVGLILLLRAFGIDQAYRVWSLLTVLVVVLGVWVYARQVLTASWAVAAAVLCSWYFATSYYLVLGFFAFQWGLAAAFVALGALEAWRRDDGKSFRWAALFTAACVACYAAHIAVFAILAGLVAAIGLARVYRNEQTRAHLVWELLPFAVLAAYHFPIIPAGPDGMADRMSQTGNLTPLLGSALFHQDYVLAGFLQMFGGGILAGITSFKLGNFLVGMFVRRSFVTDSVVLILFAGIIAGALWSGCRRDILRRHWRLAAICGLSAALYFVLPFWWEAVAYVDQRALPFFFIPLLMLALRVFEGSRPGPKRVALLIAACSALAALNLASLALFLPKQSRQVARYREALLRIPEGRAVLAIDAGKTDGHTAPLRHAGAFYAADRKGYTPYLFSQRTGSGPAEYFSDLSTLYRPPHRWYHANRECDWTKVSESYDYVIVTKPWRADRIDLSRLELQYENPVATVFRVLRSTPAGR